VPRARGQRLQEPVQCCAAARRARAERLRAAPSYAMNTLEKAGMLERGKSCL